jgi:hypothetical protein
VSEVGSGAFNDHTLTAGAYFGERALITGEPRAANVVGVSLCPHGFGFGILQLIVGTFT